MKYLSLAALLIVAGCKLNVNTPEATTTSPSPTPSSTTTSTTTTGTSPAKGTTQTTAGATTGATTASTAGSISKPASSSTSPKSSSGTTASADESKKPGYNPQRIHQLFDLKTVDLKINGQTLHTWVADDEDTRREGLMFVRDKDMKPDQAMIFVFPNASEQNFWMKHTYIPLDIAYIGEDKKVVSTATMKPFDESNVPSHGKSLYALEMKVGTVARIGITKGTTVDIPSSVKAQDPAPQQPPMGMGGGLGG